MENLKKPIVLNDGHEMPRIGLGVFKDGEGDETYNAVKWAAEAGYRHIDTASYYHNEASVGKGVRECGVKRDKMFVTTKLWNERIKKRQAEEGVDESMHLMRIRWIDLMLLHWPVDGYRDAWKVIEQMRKKGTIKSIGVSNFNPHHIETLEATAMIRPAVNQIESNPLFTNQQVIDWCQAHDIAVTAWYPFGGARGAKELLHNKVITDIAAEHGKTPAQVVIRWHLQRGVCVIPKSCKQERIKENIDVFDFELTESEMAAISGLDTGHRSGPDPEKVHDTGGF